MSRKKILLLLILIGLCLGGLFAYFTYSIVYGPNINSDKPVEFFVDADDSIADIISHLSEDDIFIDDNYIELIADKMSFSSSTPKPGRYEFSPSMSSYEVLNTLRLGKQTPIKITIQGERTIENLAGYLGTNLMYDSLHYLNIIKTDKHTSLCTYLPDTYEFYWSTDGKKFNDRMSQYHDKFWSDKTTTILGRTFSPCEIYILASIVEKETAYNPEKPDVAGVYINRLNRGMPLQADPTVIYSIGDFSIRRVLTRYLSFDSPYNTYLNPGLPPGPICMPSKSSIMAVLNASKHDYIYFCAKADNSGTHAFAETLAQHNRNARAFQRWLNQRGIRE